MRTRLILFGLLATSACAGERHNFSVLGRDRREIILCPHVAPVIGIEWVSGPPIAETGSINCEFKPASATGPHGDEIKYLTGFCEHGTVVKVTSIDLNH